MICAWCSQPADLQYHERCWERMHVRKSDADAALMRRAHAVLAELRKDSTADVPADVARTYPDQVACAKAHGQKQRKKR